MVLVPRHKSHDSDQQHNNMFINNSRNNTEFRRTLLSQAFIYNHIVAYLYQSVKHVEHAINTLHTNISSAHINLLIIAKNPRLFYYIIPTNIHIILQIHIHNSHSQINLATSLYKPIFCHTMVDNYNVHSPIRTATRINMASFTNQSFISNFVDSLMSVLSHTNISLSSLF